MTILLTGSEGLIGRHLISRLERSGIDTRRFDIARTPAEDVRNETALQNAVEGVEGVVILAAVSRVIWAERDPDKCIATNIHALDSLLRVCLAQRQRPWVLFVSSREVYGEAENFPVPETAEFRPMNVYARSKVRGEELVREAAEAGLSINICRLSSVYGCPLDHQDRVSMAFARAAAFGGSIILEGRKNTFDFTSIHDVTLGVEMLVRATAAREALPPIHLVSGVGTTLADLAAIAARNATHELRIEHAPPRSFDVAHFVGDPRRAQALLGWQAEITVAQGLPRLIVDLAAHAARVSDTASTKSVRAA